MEPKSSKQALQQLQSFKKSRKDPTEFLESAQQELGVQSEQERVAGLRSELAGTQELLKSIGPSVTGRTAGTLTTEGQRTALVAREREPVVEQLGEVQGAFGTAQASLADLISQAQTQAQLGIQGQTQELTALQDVYDRLFQQETEAQRRREAEREFEEMQRQFDEQMAFERSFIVSP
jgi:hypothetical protein